MMSFFKYYKVSALEDAKKAAKGNRTQLVTQLRDYFNKLATINHTQEDPSLTAFLSNFETMIMAVNLCNHSTQELETFLLLYDKEKLNQHPQYQNITAYIKYISQAVDLEKTLAQTRDQFITNNQRSDIKSGAVYTAILPSATMAIGIVLCFFNPAGLSITGISAATLLLSQALYWYKNKAQYDALQTKITNETFEVTLGDGKALDQLLLMPVIKQKPSRPPTSPKSIIEAVSKHETVQDAKDLVTSATNAFYGYAGFALQMFALPTDDSTDRDKNHLNDIASAVYFV